MRRFSDLFAIVFILIAASRLFQQQVYAANPEELRSAIEEKSKQLGEINSQILETQKNISSVEDKGKTLKQEIKKSDYTINQLNLGIKSSQIKIDKLGLELQSLSYEIDSKEKQVISKKEAVGNFLRELQEKDRENTLIIFLKSQSLAESLLQSQSINSLSRQISEEIDGLTLIKKDLSEKLDETATKKAQIEQEHHNLRNKKSITEDQKNDRQELLKLTKNQEKLYQDQLKALEKQQADIASEIEGIEKELRKKIDPNLLPIPRPGVLAWPTGPNARMSQGYGQTQFALKTYKGQWHNGVDIAGPIGTEIYSAEDGVVVAFGNQDLYCPRAAYGRYVTIRHENGLTTLYGHLSQYIVSQGQRVRKGELIGYMGKSGWATGSHLHFTVWSSITFLMKATRVCGLMPVGGDVNPIQYLEKAPSTQS